VLSQLFTLDINMVSCIVKGRSPSARGRFLGLLPCEAVCISSITLAEVSYGMVKRPTAKFVPLLDEFQKKSRVLPGDGRSANLWASASKAGSGGKVV
jgi:predicted nucleic acid-binding protein